MADRDADNDNDAEDRSADENWVMPIPALGAPSYAVMPWSLFERLRARHAAPGESAEFGEMIREIGEPPIRVGLDNGMAFTGGASSDLWPKPDGGAYDDGAANGIPLDLLDRLLDGEHPLKVFRRHRGLTQKELAQRTGLNATYLSQIETRKRGGSTRVYRLLAAALNVEIGDLIE